MKKYKITSLPKKRSGGQYNRRVLNDLDRFLMDPYSSKKYSKSLAATNSVFAVNDLFKKPARSRIYNPNARYLQEGGELPKAMFGKGLGKFFRKNNIQGSVGFGNTAPHLNNYVPKVGVNTIMGKPRKGFLDLGLTAGGDKKGFAGNLDATYYGPFMGGNRHFQALIDSDTYYDQGTVGSSISGGGNWIGGSRNIGNKRKDGLRKGDWTTEGGIGLQIGAFKDLNADPVSYYEEQNTSSNAGAPVLKYKPAPIGIDFGPKAHFRFQKAFGNNLTLDAKASIVADLVRNSVEGAAKGNQAEYVNEYAINPDAPNYTNSNQTIQTGDSILANEAVETKFRPDFKPSAEVKLTYNIPTGGSLFGGRKKGKTPDELDEEISVKERKPKPEKEIKPKKETKPVEVDEWARHPRWLQDGGELPKHNLRGIVKGSKKAANYFLDNVLATAELTGNLAMLKVRNPFEMVPITRLQKIKMDNIQRDAVKQGDSFVKNWTYPKGVTKDMDASVQRKIENIFKDYHNYPVDDPNFTDWANKYGMQTNFGESNPFQIQGEPLLLGQDIATSKGAQKYFNMYDDFDPIRNQDVVDYLSNPSKYRGVHGVNFWSGPSVTTKGMGFYRRDPEEIALTSAHEAAHTMQKLDHTFPNWKYPFDWRQILQGDDSSLSKRFKDALVKPGKDWGSHKSWLSRPEELHADLTMNRFKAFQQLRRSKDWANHTDEEILDAMKDPNISDELMEFIYSVGAKPNVLLNNRLGSHFKRSTPLKERLDLLKLLPGLATPFVLPGLMDDNKPKLQDGGELPKHNIRGIVKTGKNLVNEVAIGNTMFPGWRSPVGATLHHNELLKNLGRKGTFSQFNNISQTDLNPLTETLLTDYAQNSGPYKMRSSTEGTIGDGTVNWAEPNPSAPWQTPQVFDPERKKLFQEQIQDKLREINVPEETLFTRVVDRRDPNLLNIDNGVIRVGDNLNSFTVGPASNIISGGANTDRFVLTGKNLKGYEDSFLKNTYPTVTSEHAEIAKKSLFPIVNQGFNSGSIEEVNRIMNQLKKEREAIFTGSDLKIKHKVKNDRGGIDYIVRPVPLGYTTPQYERLLKNPYLYKGMGIGVGGLMLGSDDDKKKIGGVIKIRKSKLNKFKH